MGIKIAVHCISINPLYTYHKNLTIGEWYDAYTFDDIEHLKDTYTIFTKPVITYHIAYCF